jgi:hypothetical protein
MRDRHRNGILDDRRYATAHASRFRPVIRHALLAHIRGPTPVQLDQAIAQGMPGDKQSIGIEDGWSKDARTIREENVSLWEYHSIDTISALEQGIDRTEMDTSKQYSSRHGFTEFGRPRPERNEGSSVPAVEPMQESWHVPDMSQPGHRCSLRRPPGQRPQPGDRRRLRLAWP